jgi:8-amino-7-oxononanoate synthase
LGFRLEREISPVIAVTLDNEAQALAFWRALLAHGVYVNLVPASGAADGRSLLRCSMSAAHTPEQIDVIIDAFRTVSAAFASQRAA